MRKVINIFFDEFRQICRDEGIMLFIIVLPLAYPLLYAQIYNNEVQRNVPVVVVDECNSSRSRDLIRKINATPEVQIEKCCADMDEAQELMKRRQAYAVLRIPKSFDRDLWEGKQTMVGLYNDLTSMLLYKTAYVGIVNVTQDINRDIKIERMKAMSEREEEVIKMPIDFRHVMLFNPQGGFASFLIPAVLMLIIQQALCLGIGMSMGRSRERFKKHIIPHHPDYKNPIAIVFGKGLVYVLIFLVMAIYMNVCVTRWFNLPALTHFWSFVEFFVPYVMACTFMAMVYARLIYHREDCILLYVFMSVPLLFLSGISWPRYSIPDFWQIFGLLFPSTVGINTYVQVACEGARLDDFGGEILILWIQTAFYFLMACFVYSTEIRHVFYQKKAPEVSALQPDNVIQ